MWALTHDYNTYNQYGDYMITCFTDKPTMEELTAFFCGYNGTWYTPDDKIKDIFIENLFILGRSRYNDAICFYLSEPGKPYVPNN